MPAPGFLVAVAQDEQASLLKDWATAQNEAAALLVQAPRMPSGVKGLAWSRVE